MRQHNDRNNIPNPFDSIEVQLISLSQTVQQLTVIIQEGQRHEGRPFSLTEATHYLDVSKPTLYLLTSKREIPHLKRGQKLYFLKEDLDNWLLSHRIKAGDAKGNNYSLSIQPDNLASNQGEV
jgi:excisionase family DNA binding protein